MFGNNIVLTISVVAFKLNMLFMNFRYSMAVAKKHTYYLFPYISDTGTYSPESCIFSQMINLGCILSKFSLHLLMKQICFFSLLNNIQTIQFDFSGDKHVCEISICRFCYSERRKGFWLELAFVVVWNNWIVGHVHRGELSED